MSTAEPQWPMFREVLRRQALLDDMIERCGVDVLNVIHCDTGRSLPQPAPGAVPVYSRAHVASGCLRLAADPLRLRISVPIRASSASI